MYFERLLNRNVDSISLGWLFSSSTMVIGGTGNCEGKLLDGCLSSCENMVIDRSCIDMWESVNVHFYPAALEKGKKKVKRNLSK